MAFQPNLFSKISGDLLMRFVVKGFLAVLVCASILSANANAQCASGQCALVSKAKTVVSRVVSPVVTIVQNRPKIVSSCGLNLLSRTRTVVRGVVNVVPRPLRIVRNSRSCN